MLNGHANSDGVSPQMQNIMLMNWISREMKELPELQSEIPKDTNPILKVEFPPDGGILTYMQGFEHPYKGFPLAEFVEKVDTIKKLSRNMLSGFYHSIKSRNKFLLFFMFPSILIARDAFYTGIYTFYRVIERFRVKRDKYSKAMREVYRAFNYPRLKENMKILEIRLMLKDLVTMLLEFDNAYRYRFQDIITELNKENLKANSVKELNRLLDVISEREKTQEIKDTWRLLRMGLNYYLRFDRKLLKMFVDVFSELNLDEVKLTQEDKLYCAKRYDYNFGFMADLNGEDKTLIERENKLKEHNKKRNELDEKLTMERNELIQRHQNEQKAMIDLPQEIQNKIQEEINEFQKKANLEYEEIPRQIPLKYLTQEQKDLIKKQETEKAELFAQHDKIRGELAAQYGL